jgi:glycosyltransferase involved in cell wall biosynthesis
MLRLVKLLVLHYHFRPGGVRRIIELATPAIVARSRGWLTSVTLMGGEAPDAAWWEQFRDSLRPLPTDFQVEPALSYFTEQRRTPTAIRNRIRRALSQIIELAPVQSPLIWVHNLSLARNFALVQELGRHHPERGPRVLVHHHDWWFDNRWSRWHEVRRGGVRTLKGIAQGLFGYRGAIHLTINRTDHRALARHLKGRAVWLPNLARPTPPPASARVRGARVWLRDQLGDDGPVWLMPCRLLRRKNIAEAVLLMRWLRPGGWLVTTGGLSSADEAHYARKLSQAAATHHWRLRLSVLAEHESRKPSVPELMAASEAILLTSLQEGFGLPYVEAAAARRPLIARSLPNIAPDLRTFGFRFPQQYGEVWTTPDLFDWAGEVRRQERLASAWQGQLPASCRPLVPRTVGLAADQRPHPVPFSRLTLTAQLQVLAQPAERAWERCLPLNPFLAPWRRAAESGRLQATPWPGTAAHWLADEAYATRFLAAARKPTPPEPSAETTERCLREFIGDKLHPSLLYPILWSKDS